jgi:hypothetical protein
MYGVSDLKHSLAITEHTVECPVNKCTTTVARAQRGERLRQQRFLCDHHQIFISPWRFEYRNQWDNLLWRMLEDREFLTAVRQVKRQSRFDRDESDDGLVWNVFRHLEKSGSLAGYLGHLVNSAIEGPIVSYWSCSSSTRKTCAALDGARQQFGEEPHRGSEPDLIVEANGKIFWIEAKLDATNNTTPANSNDPNGYLIGGRGWFSKAFTSDYRAVAITAQRFELARLWLIGTWAAAAKNAEFFLCSIMPESRIETAFQSHIAKMSRAHFVSTSWERLYHWVASQNNPQPGSNEILEYLREKSAGYYQGRLLPAFPTLSAD